MFSAGGGGDGSSKPQTEEEIKQALREREHALRLQLKAFVSSTEFNGRSTTDFYGFGKVRAGLVTPSHHHKSLPHPPPSTSPTPLLPSLYVHESGPLACTRGTPRTCVTRSVRVGDPPPIPDTQHPRACVTASSG
jgi:hypothetical protein